MNLKIIINKWKYSKILLNKQYNFSRSKVTKYLSKSFIDEAYSTISKWKGYKKTPLIKLNKLSKELDDKSKQTENIQDILDKSKLN